MYILFMQCWEWLKANNPGSPFKKSHFNFITIHYIYIVSLSFITSLLLYAGGQDLAYIDALFLACGCATLSGLNTVDLNKLSTYQQVFFYITPMVASPIFINTFVVFVRLYWFERRFQNIVSEARNWRRSRSRTKTEVEDDTEPERLERGVDGRNIVVLHGKNPNEIQSKTDTVEEKPTDPGSESSAASSMSQGELAELRDRPGELPPNRTLSHHRDHGLVDRVPSQESLDVPSLRLPQRLSPEQHIAFLENQRNPKNKETLRIPGPREFDRGHVPEHLTWEGDGGPLSHQVTSPVEARANPGEFPFRRQITIEAPDHPRQRAETGTFSKLSRRRTKASDQVAGTGGDDGDSSAPRLRTRTGTLQSLRNWGGSREDISMPYLSWQPTIGRNSAFVDLTEEQREELGGIEYRSLKTLAVVLVAYYVFFHLLGVITLLPWILHTDTWGSVVTGFGQSKVWWGIFTPASLFNDLGFSLTPDSMISFQGAVLPLFLGSFLIIIGNTGFPCMLRFIIWISSIAVPRNSGVWEELQFLLDHPRRCFTLLFPKTPTWWLFWILVGLNSLDVLFFIVLDLHDSNVTEIGPVGLRLLNGLFQAVSTRVAGFASVNLAGLHPGIQVSYLIMMYISVLPIAISVRRTNVYEEKSLGIYGSMSDEDEDEREPSYVGAHLRRQLSYDLWYIFVGLFIIAVAEGRDLENTNEYAFTIFSCLFEIVSAYGTVGLSLGYPNTNASFSSQFHVVSKLVIIAMQIRGRHRGLPYKLDRAILLPSESLHRKEAEDAARRLQRRNSNMSDLDMSGQGLLRSPTSAPAGPWAANPGQATSTGREQENGMHGGLERTLTGHTGRSHVTHHSGRSVPPAPAKDDLATLMAEVALQPKLQPRSGHTEEA